MKLKPNRKFLAQVSTELLILITVIGVVIISLMIYIVQPKEEVSVARANDAMASVTEYANRVSGMQVGSKLRAKVEIPSFVDSVSYERGEVSFQVNAAGTKTELHKPLKTNLSGFTFRRSSAGEAGTGSQAAVQNRGIYDLIFESFPQGVCVYVPGKRDTECYCYTPASYEPASLPRLEEMGVSYYNQKIVCDIDGMENQECGSLKYGSMITGLRSKCKGKQNNRVIYAIFNRNGERVFEARASSGEEGFFNLTGMSFKVENSGRIDIVTTCYDECYQLNSSNPRFIASNITIVMVPYGTVRPFIENKDGEKIYFDSLKANDFNLSNYMLIDPNRGAGEGKAYMTEGKIKAGDNFILRTGYDCIGGECVDVDAELWHNGTG